MTSENSERLGDRRRHERGVPNGGQRHEQHTGSALGRDRACELQRQPGLPGASRSGERDEACGGISEPVLQRLHVRIAAEQDRERPAAAKRRSVRRPPRCEQARARSSSSASRVAPVRSSAADSARTVSTWGRRRSPRSSALTAWTDRPAIVASSSCVKPAASRSALSCAPNDPGAPGFMTFHLTAASCTGVVRVLCGRCGWSPGRPALHTGGMAADAAATAFVTGAAGFIGTRVGQGPRGPWPSGVAVSRSPRRPRSACVVPERYRSWATCSSRVSGRTRRRLTGSFIFHRTASVGRA